eukprot:14789306-Heterocapsa_arctica.AAC.1
MLQGLRKGASDSDKKHDGGVLCFPGSVGGDGVALVEGAVAVMKLQQGWRGSGEPEFVAGDNDGPAAD